MTQFIIDDPTKVSSFITRSFTNSFTSAWNSENPTWDAGLGQHGGYVFNSWSFDTQEATSPPRNDFWMQLNQNTSHAEWFGGSEILKSFTAKLELVYVGTGGNAVLSKQAGMWMASGPEFGGFGLVSSSPPIIIAPELIFTGTTGAQTHSFNISVTGFNPGVEDPANQNDRPRIAMAAYDWIAGESSDTPGFVLSPLTAESATVGEIRIYDIVLSSDTLAQQFFWTDFEGSREVLL